MLIKPTFANPDLLDRSDLVVYVNQLIKSVNAHIDTINEQDRRLAELESRHVRMKARIRTVLED